MLWGLVKALLLTTCKTTDRAGIHGNSGKRALESNWIGTKMAISHYKYL
jgi:hypothetical protein